jgi:hypothetical protein
MANVCRRTLQRYNLKIAVGKCVWVAAATQFIGYVVNAKGIHVEPVKVLAVEEWPTPSSVRQIREFLGLTGFYRRFVERYAAIVKPLFEAINRTAYGGTRKFSWTADLAVAYVKLKQTLVTAHLLSALEKDNLEFILHCDASKFATGAVLSQQQQGQTRVIAYFSRKPTPPETRYAAYDRELLALNENMLA